MRIVLLVTGKVLLVTRKVLLVTTFFIGCEVSNLEPDEIPLEIYMNHPIKDGIYKVVDPPYNYTSVEYQTNPNQFVEWSSPDSFVIHHFGYPIKEPIINYTTISRSDGSGKQMIFTPDEFNGRVLKIIGCVIDNCKELKFELLEK